MSEGPRSHRHRRRRSGSRSSSQIEAPLDWKWRWYRRAVVACFVLAIVLWALIYFTGDAWWGGTLLVFGPRWPFVLPLVLLWPLAFVYPGARDRILLAIATAIIAFPVTGGVISPLAALSGDQQAATLKILTCNLDGRAFRTESLDRLISRLNPDIVAFQECPDDLSLEAFPKDWQSVGQAGLKVISRFPILSSMQFDAKELAMPGAASHHQIATRSGTIDFINVHLPTPREGFELLLHLSPKGLSLIDEQIQHRDRASEKLNNWVRFAAPGLIVAGDFNMPVDSRIFRKHWGELEDAFSAAGWGWGRSKKTRFFGARIDHILVDSTWRTRRCWVEKDVGSDHLPVVAEIQLASP